MQLIRYEAMCRAIAECRSVDEVKDIRDKALALQAYAKVAQDKQQEVYCAEIRIRAERQLGQMLHDAKEAGALREGRPETVASADSFNLADAGISRDLSSRAQAIASIPEEDFEKTLSEHRDEQQAVTGRTMEKLAKQAHVSHNSGENEWYTPPEFIEAARRVMGEITLDPASCEAANANVKAKWFYTAEDDGLCQAWRGKVWMNPPYAQPLIANFCNALVMHVNNRAVTEACVLVNNGTETAWGQQLLENCTAVCFPKSRIRFIDKSGNPSGAPLQGQMIIYFGPNQDAFFDNFKKFGSVFFGNVISV